MLFSSAQASATSPATSSTSTTSLSPKPLLVPSPASEEEVLPEANPHLNFKTGSKIRHRLLTTTDELVKVIELPVTTPEEVTVVRAALPFQTTKAIFESAKSEILLRHSRRMEKVEKRRAKNEWLQRRFSRMKSSRLSLRLLLSQELVGWAKERASKEPPVSFAKNVSLVDSNAPVSEDSFRTSVRVLQAPGGASSFRLDYVDLEPSYGSVSASSGACSSLTGVMMPSSEISAPESTSATVSLTLTEERGNNFSNSVDSGLQDLDSDSTVNAPFDVGSEFELSSNPMGLDKVTDRKIEEVGVIEEGKEVGVIEEGKEVGVIEEGKEVGVTEEGKEVGVIEEGKEVRVTQKAFQTVKASPVLLTNVESNLLSLDNGYGDSGLTSIHSSFRLISRINNLCTFNQTSENDSSFVSTQQILEDEWLTLGSLTTNSKYLLLRAIRNQCDVVDQGVLMSMISCNEVFEHISTINDFFIMSARSNFLTVFADTIFSEYIKPCITQSSQIRDIQRNKFWNSNMLSKAFEKSKTLCSNRNQKYVENVKFMFDSFYSGKACARIECSLRSLFPISIFKIEYNTSWPLNTLFNQDSISMINLVTKRLLNIAQLQSLSRCVWEELRTTRHLGAGTGKDCGNVQSSSWANSFLILREIMRIVQALQNFSYDIIKSSQIELLKNLRDCTRGYSGMYASLKRYTHDLHTLLFAASCSEVKSMAEFYEQEKSMTVDQLIAILLFVCQLGLIQILEGFQQEKMLQADEITITKKYLQDILNAMVFIGAEVSRDERHNYDLLAMFLNI